MRQVVPGFLLERVAEGRLAGDVESSTLFADLTGFTRVADALSREGEHGAELLADLMHRVFEPLVHAIHAHGGFIASFAGDAFTAVLPGPPRERAPHALAAALRLVEAVAALPAVVTPDGEIALAMRVGLAAGRLEWVVLTAPGGGRCTYCFHGEALQRCTAAEQAALPGRIVLHESILPALGGRLAGRAAPPLFHLEAVRGELPAPGAVAPVVEDPAAASFVPAELLDWSHPGEFREVISLFVSVPEPVTTEALTATLHEVFRLQEEHGGYLVPVEFGDKGYVLLLHWGAPRAFEHDAELALRFAAGLRAAASGGIRAGLTSGTVFAGFLGARLREQYVCYGVPVNLAARLMAAAAPGEILLDARLASRAPAYSGIERAGSRALKGFTEPQEVFALRETRAEAQGAPVAVSARPLVGRAAEREWLTGFLAPLAQGRAAGVALVEGEAGIGKTRLLDELERAGPPGVPIRWLRCAADSVAQPAFGPFRQLLRECFEQSSLESRAENQRRFTAALEELIAGSDDAAAARQLDRERSFLGALLDLYWPGSEWERAEPPARLERSQRGLIALLRLLCAAGPLALRLEDVHWLDAESPALLARLSGALADRPFALILTARAEDAAPEVPTRAAPALAGLEPLALRLRLSALGLEETAVLAQSILSEPPAASLIEWLGERTGGNPFFIEQLLLFLRDRGQLARGVAGVSLAGGEELVPPDLRAVITARLDRLEPAVRQVVQAASVLGHEFDSRILLETLAAEKMEAVEVTRALAAAASRGVWREVEAPRYEFAHALVRDAALGMQLRATLRRRHLHAAQAMQHVHADHLAPHFARVAHHYAGAGDAANAATFYRQAAQQALRGGTPREAGERAAEALAQLELLPDSAERTRQELAVQLALGVSRIATHGQAAPETRAAYDRALELSAHAGEGIEAFQVLFGLRTFYLFRGEHRVSLRMARRCHDLATRLQDEELLLEASMALGNALFWTGALERSQAHLRFVLERFHPEQHETHLVRFAQNPRITSVFPASVGAFVLGRADTALRTAESTLALARELEHPFSEALALQSLAFVRCHRGEPAEAHQAAEALAALAESNGFPVYMSIAQAPLGWARAMLGEPEEGAAQLREASARLLAQGVRVSHTLMLALLADLCAEHGHAAEGLAAVEEALATAGRQAELPFVAELLRLRGELTTDLAEAECHLRAALRRAERQRARTFEHRARIALARLLLRTGRKVEAHAQLEDACACCPEPPMARDQARMQELLVRG